MILFNDLEPTEKVRIYDTSYKVQSDEDRTKVMVDYRTGDVYIPQLDKTEPLAAMAKDFVACVKERKTPIATAELGLEVVRILEGSQNSLRDSGREVRL
jgi:hypothetical protein